MSESTEELPLDPPLAFLQRLWELNHALERLSTRMERTLGVTAPQRFIVRCVGKFPGMTAGQLAAMLHLDRGTVSAAMRRLEQQNLLQRRRDPRDGRRVILGLTPKGRDLDVLRGGTVETAVVRLLESSDEADIVVTTTVLRRLCEALAHEALDHRSGTTLPTRRRRAVGSAPD